MKHWLVLGLVLLVAGVFFYLVAGPAGVTVAPTFPTSTPNASSTAPAPSSTALQPHPTSTQPQPPAAQGPQVKVGSVTIPVDLATTSAAVQKGLSGRLSLDADKGMLFIFSRAANYNFWMPDMHFPIDIIWISSSKKVLGVTANVSNEFDPAKPKLYPPPSPAQYVIEVNAGFAAKNGIKTGDTVTFVNI